MSYTFVFIIHIIPAFFSFYLGTTTLTKNINNVAHKLTAMILFGFSLIFILLLLEYNLAPESKQFLLTWVEFPVYSLLHILLMTLFAKITLFFGKQKLPMWYYVMLLVPLIYHLTTASIDGWFIKEMLVVDKRAVVIFGPGFHVGLLMQWLYLFLVLRMVYKFHRSEAGKKNEKFLPILMIGLVLMVIWVLVTNIFYANSPAFRELPPLQIFGTIFFVIALYLAIKNFDFLPHFEKRYRLLFDLSPSGIILLNKNLEIQDINPFASKMFNISIDKLKDSDMSNYFPSQQRELLKQQIETMFTEKQALRNTDISIIDDNGQRAELLVDTDLITVEGEELAIFLMRDVTEQKKQQEEITFLAYHDALTGLPNRLAFMNKFPEILANAKKREASFAFLVLDLNKFKQINDNYGHFIGDKALQHFSSELTRIFSLDAHVFRMGGDEFIVLLEHINEPQQAEEEITYFLTEMIDTFVYHQKNITINTSGGYSIYPKDGEELKHLYKKADKAMYASKRKAK